MCVHKIKKSIRVNKNNVICSKIIGADEEGILRYGIIGNYFQLHYDTNYKGKSLYHYGTMVSNNNERILFDLSNKQYPNWVLAFGSLDIRKISKCIKNWITLNSIKTVYLAKCIIPSAIPYLEGTTDDIKVLVSNKLQLTDLIYLIPIEKKNDESILYNTGIHRFNQIKEINKEDYTFYSNESGELCVKHEGGLNYVLR